MDQFADASSNLAQRLGDELDEVESRLAQDTFNEEGRQLGRVRLRTARVQRQLNHVRSLFHRLEPRLPSDANHVATAVRSLTLKLNSVEHEMAAVYERAHLLHDELGAKTAAITNRRLFTLAVLNACLLPPTLVSGGFFGVIPPPAATQRCWRQLVRRADRHCVRGDHLFGASSAAGAVVPCGAGR